MKNLRKFLALLLALCMLTGMLGTAAFAAGEGEEDTTETETVVCTKAEGCTAETHEEGCPLYVKPEETPEPTEEQPEEPAASPEQSPEQQPEQQPEEPSSDEATGEKNIMPALDEVEPEAASVSGTMTGADFLAKAVEGVITLDGDVTLESSTELTDVTSSVVVELNNHTLTILGNGGFNVTDGAHVSFVGGTIVANEIDKSAKQVFDVKANSSLSMEQVTFETTGCAIYPRGTAATVNVTDSVINAGAYAVSTNAESVANDGVKITLTDSTFTGLAPVMLNVNGELEMTGCTVNGLSHGVIVRCGVANISGGSISMDFDAEKMFAILGCYYPSQDAMMTQLTKNNNTAANWSSGSNLPSAALVVGNKSNGAAYQYAANVTVSGTSVTGDGNYPAVLTNSNTGADKGVTLDLSGATIIGEVEYGNVVAMVDGKYYATLQAAIDAAEPTDGVITYKIYGKADVTSTDSSWVQVVRTGIAGVSAVKFVGMTDDAEICITNSTSILADQQYDIDVSFENLKLTHPNGTWANDLGHSTNYFTCFLRNTGAAENTVTYTNCTFPNGVCNNQYGKTVFDSCMFNNNTTGKYNLWNYGGTTEVKNSEFTGTRGVKSYCEATATNIAITISNTTFDGLTEKAAILVSKPTNVTLDNIGVTGSTGLLTTDISGKDKVQLLVSGEGISGTFNIGSDTSPETAKDEFNITGGTFSGDVSAYCAAGYEATVENGTWTVSKAKTPAEKVEIAIDEALNNNKFVGVIASKADGQLNQITATVDGGYNASLTIPYAKINTGSLTLGVGMKGVESLGMRPGEKRTHVLDTNLGHRIIDLGNGEYKKFLGFSDWNGFQVNTTVKDGAAENTVSYTFGVTQTNDDVTLNATTTAADARAAWKAIFANATASTGTADSKIIVAEGSYLQAGTKKVTLEQPGDLVLDHFQNLNWAALRDMFQVQEEAYPEAEAQTTKLFLKKGTTLAVGDSKVVLDKDVTISTESLKEGTGSQIVQLVQTLAGGTLDAESQKMLTTMLLANIVGLPNSVDGASDTTKAPLNITVEFAESVAEVNGKGYMTLQAAITAAGNGDTVTLLKDVVLSSAVTISKNITLDLNGRTISRNTSNQIQYLITVSGAELTVKDSLGEGKIVSARYMNNKGKLRGTPVRVTDSGILNVQSGSITGAQYGVHVSSGTVNISGGRVEGTETAGIIAKSATVNLTGGKVAGNTAVDMQGGKINVSENALVEGGWYGISLQNANVSDAKTAAELAMTGGKVSVTNPGGQAICGNNLYSQGTTATISGGTIEGGTGIYWPMAGTLNISGDVAITGSLSGIEVKQGTVNISGGTIKATGEYREYAPSGNGTVGSGWALAVSTQQYATTVAGVSSDVVVNITGGTFVSEHGTGIETINMGKQETNGTITISGDVEVNAASGKDAIHTATGSVAIKGDKNVAVAVSGGTFSSDVNDYCVADKIAVEKNADGTFVVETLDATNATAQVGDSFYKSLQAAIDAAESGDVVTLLKNATGSGVIIEKNITIDFNTKRYTVSKDPVGSGGTETNGFQLLAGADTDHPNTVVMKNGYIDLPSTTENLKMGIQNYCNLTLEGMTIDASGNSNITYVVSNNNGSTTISCGTKIKAPANGVAFDVYDYSANGYGNVSVTVEDAEDPMPPVEIVGAIEVSESNIATLTVKGGKFDTDVSKYVVAGKGWNSETGAVEDLTVTLNRTTARLTVGYRTTTVTLEATTNVTPADATVTWTSSNTAVVTVSDAGVVTPVGSGTATVTATVSGKTATCTVNVTRTYAPYVPPVTDPDEELEDPDVPLAGLPFVDVERTDWFFGAISSVYLRELMIGISGTEFGPEMPSNRGTVATILHRMENTPDAEMNDFADVLEGKWYTPAINWANQTGVMIGYDTGVFQPEAGITREQLALTFFRYYKKIKGAPATERADLSTFADSDRVSAWAREAMEWAVGCGLLKGTTENQLVPQGLTKRSELAAVLERFLEMD